MLAIGARQRSGCPVVLLDPSESPRLHPQRVVWISAWQSYVMLKHVPPHLRRQDAQYPFGNDKCLNRNKWFVLAPAWCMMQNPYGRYCSDFPLASSMPDAARHMPPYATSEKMSGTSEQLLAWRPIPQLRHTGSPQQQGVMVRCKKKHKGKKDVIWTCQCNAHFVCRMQVSHFARCCWM